MQQDRESSPFPFGKIPYDVPWCWTTKCKVWDPSWCLSIMSVVLLPLATCSAQMTSMACPMNFVQRDNEVFCAQLEIWPLSACLFILEKTYQDVQFYHLFKTVSLNKSLISRTFSVWEITVSGATREFVLWITQNMLVNLKRSFFN